MTVTNPFIPIYRAVNSGTTEEKYNKIYNSNGGGRYFRYILTLS